MSLGNFNVHIRYKHGFVLHIFTPLNFTRNLMAITYNLKRLYPHSTGLRFVPDLTRSENRDKSGINVNWTAVVSLRFPLFFGIPKNVLTAFRVIVP